MSEKVETEKTDRRSDRVGALPSLGRTVQSGQVRQSFSHGRSKSVQVEKRRKRVLKPGSATDEAIIIANETDQPPPPASLDTLSVAEQEKRRAAVTEAKLREAETYKQAETDARRQAEAQAEQTAQQQAEAQAGKEDRRKEKSRKKPAASGAATANKMAGKSPSKNTSKAGVRPHRDGAQKPRNEPRRTVGERRRRAGKLTINDALNDEERVRSLASMRRRREREKQQAISNEPTEKMARNVQLPETITIQELANRMAERAVDVIKILMQQGIMAKINDVIDADTAQIVAEDLGHIVRRVSDADIEQGVIGEADRDEDKKQRPPVVTVMGHVDHGKTSLLDALRQTKVAAGEAGGITQHIGAYQTSTKSGAVISFIDTPGHAAFTAMRARGAKVTDIVILVVAADDGVMPQTVEAINHAKAAHAPIIVAINKMDKAEADPKRVKNDLLQQEIIAEEMGGDTQMVEVSAHSGAGLDDLLEAVALQAELLDLKANPDREAEGVVIEARLDKGRGPVATVLVQRGTLNVGDVFVVGQHSGRARAIIDDHGQRVDHAGPAMPVEVLGANGAPSAGDVFSVVENEARAREVADYRERIARDKASAAAPRPASLDQMMSQLKDAAINEFTLLVKGDVQGSVEAIAQAIEKLSTDEVITRVVLDGVGGITESDVTLARTAGAVVAGFNVRANAQARQAAEDGGVEIRYYNVIYDLVDDVKAAMAGLLSPDLRETALGTAELLQVFSIGKGDKAAGCLIQQGLVRRGARVRLIRDDIVIHEGELSSLRRFKDEVREVESGQECGMAFTDYADLKSGDMIECYEVEEVVRTLDD